MALLVASAHADETSTDWQSAQAALKSGSYAEAEAGFRKFLQSSPSVAEAHVNLGLALHLQKKNEEAIASFRRGIALQPRLAHAYLFLGIDLFNLNNTADAIPELKRYIAIAPRDPQGHYYLGLCFASRGEVKASVEAFEAASAFAPRDVDILYHLAQAYISAANAIVKRVAEHDSTMASLREWEKAQQSGMGELVRRTPVAGTDKETLRSLQGRLSRTPPDVPAEQRAAAAYANLYLQTTRRFVEIEPDSFRVHQLLAAYYEKTGQTDKAIEELQKVLQQNVQARGLHFALGSMYKDHHKPELAVEEFQRELQVSSPEPETRIQLAQVYLVLQRPDDALSELAAARQHLGDNNGNYWRTLGKAQTASGNHAEAAVSYERALRIGPADRALLYQLAQAYRRLGRLELARKMLAASSEAAKRELEKEQAHTQKALSEQQKERQSP